MNSSRLVLAAALAELEQIASQERIRTAVEDAKRRGHKCGRPGLLKSYQVDFALRLIGEGESLPAIAQRLHCGHATLSRAIAARG
jgi:DNA invertase Pin-like site-specific DNA recombinase